MARSRLPLRRKFPLLISLLIGVVVAAISWLAHGQLEQALLSGADQRAVSSAQQFAGLLHESVLRVRRDASRLASHPLVVSYLANPSAGRRADAEHVLAADLPRNPQVVSRRLVTRSGTRQLVVGDARPGALPMPERAATDSGVTVGELDITGDSVVYQLVAPVTDASGHTLGYFVETRRPSSQTVQRMSKLIGHDATVLLGNERGVRWTSLSRAVAGPAHDAPRGVALAYEREAEARIGAIDGVPSTPWIVAIELPRRAALAAARAFLVRAGVIALVVVLVGALAVWVSSRAITEPLEAVSRAAEGIAAGDYSQRAPVRGHDEIGRLATSFNAMAERVEAASRAVERQSARREETLTLLDVILASAPVGFALLDPELRYLRVNDALANLNGVSPDAHIGRAVDELQPEFGGEKQALLQRVLRDRDFAIDVELVRPGGNGAERERTLRGSFFPVAIGDAPPLGVGIFVAETSERRALEAQLQQAQKMEAVGQLAGGVAHDFNNLLTVITSYTTLVLQSLPKDSALVEDMREIENAAGRASALTRQLLAFSRRQLLQPRLLDLNALTANLEKMLRRLLREDIELVTAFEPRLGSVSADPGQLEQIIINLAVNARDAMPEGGRLTIETARLTYDPASPNGAALPPGTPAGTYVMLGVSDTGHGIDEATRANIFDPFFTTKPVGQGTGLGLATVYGIVKQSGGYIGVTSEVGHGSTFRIFLPAAGADAPDHRPAEEAIRAAGGPERILLVEDEPNVRRIARRILEQGGYKVVEAANGAEALRIVESRREPIALVVTDLVMPEMGGRELATRLHAVSPTSRVLFMTGYTEDAVVRQRVMESEALLIEKPFTVESFTAKVREALRVA